MAPRCFAYNCKTNNKAFAVQMEFVERRVFRGLVTLVFQCPRCGAKVEVHRW